MARPKKDPQNPRALREEASKLTEKGKHDKAAKLYLQLADVEPAAAGDWARRAADCYRRLGEKAAEIDALGRAAEGYQRAGFSVKAVAMCKIILGIDPRHTRTQDKLAVLQGAQPKAAPVLLQPPTRVAAPLVELPLGATMAGARQSAVVASSEPVHELPLEPMLVLTEEPAPADTADPEALRERALEVLPKTALFSDLSPTAYASVIDRSRLIEVADGDVVCKEGDAADCLFVLAEGSVAVSLEHPKPVALGTLGEGAFFGEIALVSRQPRTATVRAVGPGLVLAIDRAAIDELVAREPSVLVVVLRFLRDRLIEQLVARMPIFEPFAGRSASSLAARFQLLEAEPGAVLIRQGEKAKGLFILMCGKAVALRDDSGSQKVLGELGTGDLCGEMSLLSGEPAVATVRAETKCLALALSAKDFLTGVMVHPTVLEMADRLAEARRAQNAAIVEGARYAEVHLDVI